MAQPTTYRVLHTADWHLGKLLGEHSREAEHQRFLAFLLRAIREQAVDLLVIAGDVFDSANPPQSAAAQYYNFLSELFRQGGCSVVIVAGNHDSPAHLEAPRQVLKALGAHVLGAWPATPAEVLVPLPNDTAPRLLVAAVPFLRDRDLRTGQCGQSQADIRQALVEGIQRRYADVAAAAKPWTDRGVPVLATGHLTVLGAKSSESEREIHIGGLGAVSAGSFPPVFDYVALGHLHRPQAPGGQERVRYSGSPIPLSFSEAGDRKAMQLLEFAGGRLTGQTALDVPLARPLAQIRAQRQSLEAALTEFQPPPGELPAWVEVVVDDPIPGENLYDRVQQFAGPRGFQVIRVGIEPAMGSDRPLPVPADAQGLADLLAQPAKVFARRLETEPGLSEGEKERLRTLFLELLELQADPTRQLAEPRDFHGKV